LHKIIDRMLNSCGSILESSFLNRKTQDQPFLDAAVSLPDKRETSRGIPIRNPAGILQKGGLIA